MRAPPIARPSAPRWRRTRTGKFSGRKRQSRQHRRAAQLPDGRRPPSRRRSRWRRSMPNKPAPRSGADRCARNDSTRTGGEILVDQLAIHGVRHVFCVPGESYLAALDAFHDRDIALTVCRHESGAADDGGSGRQGDRPARHLFRHARAGRHQCLGRHPHRAPGFHADDRVRRPGRRATCASARRSRSSITARCSARSPNGRPKSTIPRASRKSSRAPSTPPANGRPGPVVIALPEDMLTERVAVPDAAAFEPVEIWPGLDRHEPAAEAAVGGEAPDRAGRRQPLVGSSAAPRWRALPSASRCRSRPPSAAGICSTRCIPVTPAISASGPIRNCWRASKAPTWCC